MTHPQKDTFVLRVAWGSFGHRGEWYPNKLLFMPEDEQYRQNVKNGFIEPNAQPCAGCKYEIEHEGRKVCRTMTRKHGQGCDAYREKEQ